MGVLWCSFSDMQPAVSCLEECGDNILFKCSGLMGCHVSNVIFHFLVNSYPPTAQREQFQFLEFTFVGFVF